MGGEPFVETDLGRVSSTASPSAVERGVSGFMNKRQESGMEISHYEML